MKTLVVGAICLTAAGCASRADNISASYVSPMTYKNYTCAEIEREAQQLSQRAATATAAQNSKATGDAVATGVGVVLFLPALFFIKGEGASAGNIANLKGQMHAIQQASDMRQCGLVFQAAPGK